MDEITQKLKEMMKSRKKRKLVFKQSDVRSAKILGDDLSVK